MKKIPLRRCVVTKEQLPKKELLRIVRDKDGNINVDTTSKANGRGTYIKKDLEVLKIAKEKKIIDRVFEIKIEDKVYDKIEEIIKNQ